MSALHKDNSGYDLRDLLIGAEGTLGIITAAVLKLCPRPRAYATAMVALPGLGAALDLLNRLQEDTGGAVEAFEYMPAHLYATPCRMPPMLRAPFDRHPSEVNVLVEIGATAPRDATPGPDGSLPIVALLEDTLAAGMDGGAVLDAVVARSEAQRAEMWERRELAAEITFSRQPAVDNDIALPLDPVAVFLDRDRRGWPMLDPGAQTIIVAHLGDGNIHYAVWPDPRRCRPARRDHGSGRAAGARHGRVVQRRTRHRPVEKALDGTAQGSGGAGGDARDQGGAGPEAS